MNVIQPMLAESVDPKNIEKLLANPKWRLEQKFDGHRVLMHVENNKPVPYNRKGIRQSSTASTVLNAFTSGFEGEWVFDGELMVDRNEYHIFDLLKAGDFINLNDAYNQRRFVLEQLFECWNTPESVKLVPSYMETEDKRRLYETVKTINGEGLMLKDGTAKYVPGKRVHTMLKCKFYKSADCIVTELWREGKHSVGLAVFDERGRLIPIGACSMSAANMARLQVGSVVEIKYLYLGAGNRLYQPAFLRVRNDRIPESCDMSQMVRVNKEVVIHQGK